jgi:hypothetical protein
MNRLSDSIIHCVHSKPNGYQNHQTRRSGHHQEGDLGTPLTVLVRHVASFHGNIMTTASPSTTDIPRLGRYFRFVLP